MNTPRESIIIVDDNDTIIGYKDRKDVKQADTYRVSALWITNSRGDILLAQRAFTKTNHPGMWGPAVAGTVDEGESYDENIIKEMGEELGLTGIRPTRSVKQRRRGEHNYFCQLYTLTMDKPAEDFTLQKEEVAQVKWFTPGELALALKKRPDDFTPSVKAWVSAFA